MSETTSAQGQPWTRCNQCGEPEHGSIPCNLVGRSAMTGDKLAALEERRSDLSFAGAYANRSEWKQLAEDAIAALRSAPDSPQKDSLRVGGLQWESVSASSASRLPEGGFAWRPTHRHVKRGSDYMVLGTGYIQTDEPLFDSDAVVIYRAEDGSLWARKYSEFKDGRFQPLPQEANPPPVQREAREALDEAAAPEPTVRKDGSDEAPPVVAPQEKDRG